MELTKAQRMKLAKAHRMFNTEEHPIHVIHDYWPNEPEVLTIGYFNGKWWSLVHVKPDGKVVRTGGEEWAKSMKK